MYDGNVRHAVRFSNARVLCLPLHEHGRFGFAAIESICPKLELSHSN